MTVLGISSSPIRNGNVDRMVKFILENSGKPFPCPFGSWNIGMRDMKPIATPYKML